MAEKRITVCDRCSKEIVYKVFPVLEARIDYTVKFGFGDCEYKRRAFDLCRNCTKAFERFLGERKENETDQLGEMMATTKNILLELNERLNEMYLVLYGARYSEVKDVEVNSMTEAMENIGRLADMAICNTMAIRNCL